MSEKQPDREKEGGAPEGPKNPWVNWLAWLIVAPVLYVFSAGPLLWLVQKGLLPLDVVYIYAPLNSLGGEPQRLVQLYLSWWLP